MRISLLVALLAALLMGCGGSGNRQDNTADSEIPEQYMQALRTAVLTRDVDFIRSKVATEYLNDCENKSQFVNAIMSILGTGGNIEFTIDPISQKSVNENLGRAEFNGGFTLRVVEGAETRTMSRSGTMTLRRDNGPWQLYGDQGCEL